VAHSVKLNTSCVQYLTKKLKTAALIAALGSLLATGTQTRTILLFITGTYKGHLLPELLFLLFPVSLSLFFFTLHRNQK
jgi:hypothetical protein